MSSPRSPRAYLLMEVMIASAITAVALAGLLSMAGNGLVLSTTSARELTAQGLVAQGIELVRMQGYGAVTAQTATAMTTVKGSFTREITVVAGTEVLFGTISTAFRDVTVTVSRPSPSGPETSSAKVRLYE